MADGRRQRRAPRGGLQVQANIVRRWRWSPEGELLSAAVRCKREQWYLARAFPAEGAGNGSADLLLRFLRTGEVGSAQRVTLARVAGGGPREPLLGWVQAPEWATHLQVHLRDAAQARRFERLVLHPVAERDPKCHPLANVPRWSTYRPAFPIERVVLPKSLAALADHVDWAQVELVGVPRSLRSLAARVIGAACIIDPQWVRALGLSLHDLERVAAASRMIVDLETLAVLVNRSDRARTRVVAHAAEHEIMSARVEYADVPTRGFALQDVLPYATLAGEATFQTRVMLATRSWKSYAAEVGFATLLSSETPWEKKCGDVLSAARAVDQGEFVATDLPWLLTRQFGRLLAPRLAEHLLRMHLGGPIDDNVQYWNRTDDCPVIVRDLADLDRRYPPLRAVRWAPAPSGVARLGITLPAAVAPGTGRHLMICSGRIDQHAVHDGVPPEPMAIFIKSLAREVRERTRWACRFLSDTTVSWQFDTAAGLKYALHYDSAASPAGHAPQALLILRAAGSSRGDQAVHVSRSTPITWSVPADAGIFGDRSLIYQAELNRRLRGWIERASA
jgi:hypothetical protein